MASAEPAAPSRWPVIDLVELIGTRVSGAEHMLDHSGLRHVPQGRGGAVGVDVVDCIRGQPRIGEGVLHANDAADAAFQRAGDVVGVRAHAEAQNLSVDVGAPGLGPIVFPPAPARRRLRRARSRPGRGPKAGWRPGVVVARGQGLHGGEPQPPSPARCPSSAPPATMTSASPC